MGAAQALIQKSRLQATQIKTSEKYQEEEELWIAAVKQVSLDAAVVTGLLKLDNLFTKRKNNKTYFLSGLHNFALPWTVFGFEGRV